MLDSPTGIDNQGIAQWGEDKSIVVFFKGSRHNAVRSQAEGAPAYDDIDMVRVIHPGENDGNGIETQALDIHKYRWPRQWEAYQKGQEFKQNGTPVEMLFPSSPATAQELKAKNIYTIQQLAVLDDNVITRNPMLHHHRVRALQYLEAAKKGSNHHELVAKNEVLESDLTQAKADLEEMKQQIAALQAASPGAANRDARAALPEAMEAIKRGPGRPPKPRPEIPADPAVNPYDPAS